MKTRTGKAVGTQTFNSRLAAYSATAGAALLAAPAAEAAVKNITSFSYSGILDTMTPPSVDQSGFEDLLFKANTVSGNIAFSGRFILSHAVGGGGFDSGIARILNSKGGAFATKSSGIANLGRGSALAGQNFFPNHLLKSVAKSAHQPTRSRGLFGTGYLGFRNTVGTHHYYGWLRLKVTDDSDGVPDAISLLAESSNPSVFGQYGTAGESISTVPEPGGLALLAIGAAGVMELRRRRQAAKAV